MYNKPSDLNLYKVLLNYDENVCRNMNTTGIVKHYSEEDIDSLKCKISFHDFEKNDSDFPKRVDIYKDIAMSTSYEERYHQIMEEIMTSPEERPILQSIFKNLTQSNQNNFENLARRAIQSVDNSVENKKIDTLIKYIERMKDINAKLAPKDKFKVVVYSQFKTHGIYLVKDKVTIPSAIISGDTKVQDRQNIVNQYNQGKINVLFITKAGEEGLDLKGTDAVFLIEPSWNENTREQVIARAIRYKSHENRPADRKVVKVFNLIHTTKKDRSEETQNKIKSVMRQTHDKIPPMNVFEDVESIDLLMSNYQRLKQKVLDNYDRQLKELTIENNSCNKSPVSKSKSINDEWKNFPGYKDLKSCPCHRCSMFKDRKFNVLNQLEFLKLISTSQLYLQFRIYVTNHKKKTIEDTVNHMNNHVGIPHRSWLKKKLNPNKHNIPMDKYLIEVLKGMKAS